ncbi:ph domain-containing protein [Pyrenophora tritici-repentis]|nr:ph domain-containing protein [Pyrenophora tritici-repentis]KAF7444795.1 ph domain-containing protein [Pyrenophora tritici-repentis]KAG9379033.1 ph domain-containing protein [Pyrenophora tritici-repentis]KAI0586728.1 ph domain-containing protein [Pyrenophora tritici-repentis]KAI0614450.1 ph domain-containing protein [Pyrenophora tritici-repentis]
MEPNTETMAERRSTRNRSTNASSSTASAATYGYHNTYHTHAQLPIGSPPSYSRAIDPETLRLLDERTRTEKEAVRNMSAPPPYTCTVEIGGIVGIKQELSSPFQVSGHREWHDVYAILRGTQLSLYRIKNPRLLSKNKQPTPGRLLRTYSLQHAEVGVAADFKKTALVPKSPFAHLVPAVARPKLYESDPQLFEPVREHALRLRLEFEQFLLCPSTHEGMLDWIESFCAAVDISLPLEDRSEPRYRSLPRRSRRQRILENVQFAENIESLTSLEAGRRIVAQQEQIIRQLYPHLAGTRDTGSTQPSPAGDAEIEEFDPEDVRFPARVARDSLVRMSSQDSELREDDSSESTSPSDPKSTPATRPSSAQTLRYRRRCAPVLLASSPRVSDVVFGKGQRFRISIKAHMLVEYTSHPPRYDAHGFSRSKRSPHTPIRPNSATRVAEKTAPENVTPDRPSSPMRGVSDDSITSISFGKDLATVPSKSNPDETGQSGPPSPTTESHTKVDAASQMEAIGKTRHSVDSRENDLNTVALGVTLLI